MRPVFEHYVEGRHGVKLHPAHLSETIAALLGERTTFALFFWGCREYPAMATPAFATFMQQTALGACLATAARSGKVALHKRADWHQQERVREWLRGPQLQAVYASFQAEVLHPR